MNRNPIIVTTTRSHLGACACVHAGVASLSREAKLANFGGASPHPGPGGVSS
jgi:hypothetical protein